MGAYFPDEETEDTSSRSHSQDESRDLNPEVTYCAVWPLCFLSSATRHFSFINQPSGRLMQAAGRHGLMVCLLFLFSTQAKQSSLRNPHWFPGGRQKKKINK